MSEEYKNYLNFLKEKSRNAIRITKKNTNLKFLGEYAKGNPIKIRKYSVLVIDIQ